MRDTPSQNLFLAAKRKRKSNASKKPVPVVIKKAPRSTATRIPNGIKSSSYLKQHYSADLKTLACTSGAWAYHQFTINNIYDLDYTGTGSQPYLFDQMAALYAYYRVIGYKMTAYASNATNVYPFALMTLATPSVAGASDAQQLRELNLKKRIKFAGANNEVIKTSLSLKPWNVLGVKKSQYMSDDTYRSAVGTAPENIAYCTVYAQPFDEATTANIKLHVEIELLVRYEQNKIVSRS